MNKDIEKILKKNKYRSRFYRNIKQTEKKDKTKLIKMLYSFMNKVLISIILLFVLLISKNDEHIGFIYNFTFKNMNFAKIDAFFQTRLSGIFPKTTNENLYVNDIVINIDNSEIFLDGVIVETEPYQTIQSHTEGIVIRIYEDDKLGNTLVIQNSAGYLYTYGYLEDIKVNLYSRIQYGEVLGVGKVTEDMTGEFYLSILDNETYMNVVEVVNDES